MATNVRSSLGFGFQKMCRNLQCPPGEAFADDTCVAFIHDLTHMRMKIYLEIVAKEPTNPVMESFKEQLDEKASTLVRTLNRFLNVRWGATKPTRSLIFRETSSVDISHMKLHYVTLFSFEGISDVRVTMEKMFNALRVGLSVRMLGVPMKIMLGRNFEIDPTSTKTNDNLASLFGDADTIIEPIGSATADIGTQGFRDYRTAQSLNKLAFCKRVELEEDEIELLRYNSSAVGMSQTYFEYVFYDKDGSMCLDDFERAFLPLGSAAASFRLHVHVVYLACLIVYI